MTAFTYPPLPLVRRHGPQGYADYPSYRPWLRDEFVFRCVYCLRREQWGRVTAEFAVDHFLPISRHPDRATEYANLLYSCSTCNCRKGDSETPDPSLVLTRETVDVDETGLLVAHTAEARRAVLALDLNGPEAREFRELWLDIIQLAQQADPELFRRLMAYPDDLPDLASLRPPAGNTRPEGVAESHLERRNRGELPETY